MSFKHASEFADDVPKSPLSDHNININTNVYSRHLVDLYEDDSIDPVYQAKARVINRAIQDIGMGRYQVDFILTQVGQLIEVFNKWYLFIVAGFGWFA